MTATYGHLTPGEDGRGPARADHRHRDRPQTDHRIAAAVGTCLPTRLPPELLPPTGRALPCVPNTRAHRGLIAGVLGNPA